MDEQEKGRRHYFKPKIANFYVSTQIEFRHAVNGIGILSSRSLHIEMFVASASFMAAEHGCQNGVTAVSDVSCNMLWCNFATVPARSFHIKRLSRIADNDWGQSGKVKPLTHLQEVRILNLKPYHTSNKSNWRMHLPSNRVNDMIINK